MNIELMSRLRDDIKIMVEIGRKHLDDGRFSMKYWYQFNDSWDDNDHVELAEKFANNECGTTACLLGGALVDPRFMARGLSVAKVLKDAVFDMAAFVLDIYPDVPATQYNYVRAIFFVVFHKDYFISTVDQMPTEFHVDADLSDRKFLEVLGIILESDKYWNEFVAASTLNSTLDL